MTRRGLPAPPRPHHLRHQGGREMSPDEYPNLRYPMKANFIGVEESEGHPVFHFELESTEFLAGVRVSGKVRIALEVPSPQKTPQEPTVPSAEVWLQLQARFQELVRYVEDCVHPKPQNPREQERAGARDLKRAT